MKGRIQRQEAHLLRRGVRYDWEKRLLTILYCGEDEGVHRSGVYTYVLSCSKNPRCAPSAQHDRNRHNAPAI